MVDVFFKNLQCVRHGAMYFTKIVSFNPSPI